MRAVLNFNFYNLIYFFVFYSFAGWCLEVLYYFKNERRFVNRGFLYGPFCPIYGFGVLFLVVFLDNYKNNIFALFFLACFFTTVLEYITGFVLEKAFKTKWWDYTDDPLNIHGRVCLLYSLLWGVGEVGIIKIIHPIVVNIINNIPKTLGEVFIFFIIIYYLIDFSLTIASLMQFEKMSFAFQFVPANFLFDKPSSLLNFTKEKAIGRIRHFESFFSKLKMNLYNKQSRQNFSSISYRSLNIFKALRDKLKRD
ncbi:putative ABC transporter permease [Clostridium beijerinckii]|uniref:putative ABC transporter permease n=1 Tax=Clostridium beijerinckii TaxID=1520 RepID=UPI001F41C5A8|nr:putative ABC transporter permease [Clostridium beijerinckii]